MAELKKLVFGEGLMTPTLDGDKTFTIRRYRPEAHDFKKGDLVIGEFKDGLNILLRITRDTLVASFWNLARSPKKKLDKNGFYFDDEYFKGLAAYYPDLKWEEQGAVIFTEVYRVDGVPAVSFNEHTSKE